MEDRIRYSDADLQEFKAIIQQKIEKAEKDWALLRESFINDQNNGTDDTSPTFKAFEEGAETLSKEQNAILAGRQEKFIRDLKHALIRIENNLRNLPCNRETDRQRATESRSTRYTEHRSEKHAAVNITHMRAKIS